MRRVVLWCVALLCVVSCATKTIPPVPVQPVTARVDVDVWYGDEKVPGASVTLDAPMGQVKPSQTADAYGNTSFLNRPIGDNHIWVTAPGYQDFNEHLDIVAPLTTKTVHLTKPYARRTGIVHANGRMWADDQGTFYPLGETLFWAVRGWKYEPDRVRQNLAFVADHHYDYVRVLCEVGWPGNDIRPDWPDYETVLADFIDAAYDDYGLRVELTLVGGGTGTDYVALTQHVINVVKPRPEKVISLEVSNEFQIKDLALQKRLLLLLRANLPHLIAETDSTNISLGEVPGTKQFFADGATYGTVHLSRTVNGTEAYWRHVRQSWDFRVFDRPLSHNEPGGPLSSVNAFAQPIHLVMSRVVGITNGLGAYVLHNGAGVTGQIDSARNRPANLWEVPDIAKTMDILRAVDAVLPANAMDGTHYRCCGQRNHPFGATNVWSEVGSDVDKTQGVVRDYAVDYGPSFIVTAFGIKHHADFVASRAATLRIIDPVTLQETTRAVSSGERVRLTPASTDANGQGAFIILGTNR